MAIVASALSLRITLAASSKELFKRAPSLGKSAHRPRRLLSALVVVCLLALSGSYSLCGQTPLSQMYHRAWTVRDGAPNDIVTAVQGPDGFLWITTEDGLYRFDGVTFERYEPPPGTSLLSDQMYGVFVARDGAVWLSYFGGGVTRIKGDQIDNFTTKEGLLPGHVGAILEDKDGRIWLGSAYLQVIDKGRVTSFRDEKGAPVVGADNLVFDSEGNLWMPQNGQLRVLIPTSRKVLMVAKEPYFDCNLSQTAGVLCITETGLVTHFTVSQLKISSQPLMKDLPILSDVFTAHDGTIWLGTETDGIRRVRDEHAVSSSSADREVEAFTQSSGLSGEFVKTQLADKEGSIWILTNRGIDQFRPVPIQRVPLDYPRIQLPASPPGARFLIGTDHLAEIVNGSVHSIDQTKTSFMRCLYQADDGTVWVCGPTLRRYSNGQVQDVPVPMISNRLTELVSLVVEDSSHNIWASLTTHGLYRLDQGGWSKRGGLTGLPEVGAASALRLQRGDLWFGWRRNILARISGGHVTRFDASNGVNVGDILVLAERSDAVWLGGDHGIMVFDHGVFRAFMLNGGKALRRVSGLAFLSNGDLWINSSTGVFRVARDELSKWDGKPDYAPQARLFDYLDGMNGIPKLFEEPTAVVAPDGMLYLASDRSLERIDPLHLPENRIVPQVWIRKIVTAEGSKPVSDSVRLNPDAKQLEISYTAPSLLIPERVRFRYQLTGFDKDWVDAGTRRQAFYAKLPAGTYTFRVTACNDSGVWNDVGTSIQLIVPPTWIETIWFRLAIVVAFAALMIVGFRLRVRHLKRKLIERLNERFAERERIARDLHDTLFQGVEGGLLVINSVTSRLSMEPVAKHKLQDAFSELNDVLASARNIIFNRLPPTETFGFEQSIEMFGEQIGLLSHCRFSVTSSGTRREIRDAVCEELLKLVKESLTNAFRHAGASEIKVQTVYTRTAVEVCIDDDGTGIDPKILAEGGRLGHGGLRGMRQRAANVGGQFSISRRDVGGTEVRIKVPAKRAYRSRVFDLAAKWLRGGRDRQDTAA
jgi:signal transduction histidine kinase/ligand-binding sensor domain-containing protein